MALRQSLCSEYMRMERCREMEGWRQRGWIIAGGAGGRGTNPWFEVKENNNNNNNK